MQNHLFKFNLHRGFQESKRSNPNSSSGMSNVPIQAKILISMQPAKKKRKILIGIYS